MSGPYVDTSALAKLYLNERGSEQFEAFLLRQERAVISRLTALEFRCVLARRRRAQELSPRLKRMCSGSFAPMSSTAISRCIRY